MAGNFKPLLYPYIRFLNATDSEISFKMPSKNIHLKNTDIISPYIKASRGMVVIKTYTENAFKTTFINLKIGDIYTLCAFKTNEGYDLKLINDNYNKENSSCSHLRICNLIYNKNNIAAYANDMVFCKGINFLDTSKYIDFIPESYDIKFKASENEFINDSAPLKKLKEDNCYTCYLISSKTSSKAEVLFINDFYNF